MPQELQVTHHYILRQIVDEILLVPISPEARQKNQLLVLNPSAAFIYEKIRMGLPKKDILALMQEEFSASDSEIESDFTQLTVELNGLGALCEKSTEN